MKQDHSWVKGPRGLLNCLLIFAFEFLHTTKVKKKCKPHSPVWVYVILPWTGVHFLKEPCLWVMVPHPPSCTPTHMYTHTHTHTHISITAHMKPKRPEHNPHKHTQASRPLTYHPSSGNTHTLTPLCTKNQLPQFIPSLDSDWVKSYLVHLSLIHV